MRLAGPFPIALLIGGVACGASASADVSPVGAWTVVAYYAQDPQTGQVTYPFGESVTGAAIYSAHGHMSVFVSGRDRSTAPAAAGAERDAARAHLWESMYAYTGTFAVKGDMVTIHVESAWQPDWVGTDKVRQLTLDGDTLTITTLPMRSPVDGRTYISVTKFRRVE